MISEQVGMGPRSFRFLSVLSSAVRHERSATADAHLGLVLALVAGATNAGGFLAVGQYTSHMSGVVSSLADNLALGDFELVAVGLSAFFGFVLGAAASAILINWGRRHHAESQYTLPLVVEAILLLVFGLVGGFRGHVPYFIYLGIPLLCFIMGLQNAMITKVSQARIRTTHLTGIVTDIGIELGKLIYSRRNRADGLPPVVPDFKKLQLYLGLLGSFLGGALIGALGFKYVGFISAVPLALVVLVMAGLPMIDQALRRRPWGRG